jgi:hypothetical protein
MANRLMPLALSLSVLATGCAHALLAGPTGKAKLPAEPVAASKEAPTGFGSVKVDVSGLRQVPGFSTQTLLNQSIGKGVLIVRNSSTNAIVTDVSGNPAAYFFTVPAAGNATITIPDLPSTATSTTTALTTGTPYRFELRAFTASQAIPLLGDNFHVDTTSGAFSTDVTVLTDADMKASGETKAHVVAGLPVIVTVLSFAHFGSNLSNTGTVVKSMTLTGVPTIATGQTAITTTTTANNILRVRLTDVQAAKLGSSTAQAKAAFTIGGTPKAGDVYTLTAGDNADSAGTYALAYTVPPGGETAATTAANLAAAIDAQTLPGSGANHIFADSYTASNSAAVLTLSGMVASSSFANFNSATLAVTTPAVKTYTVTESNRTAGDATTAYFSVQTLEAISILPAEDHNAS